jgi:hypothetical protein
VKKKVQRGGGGWRVEGGGWRVYGSKVVKKKAQGEEVM